MATLPTGDSYFVSVFGTVLNSIKTNPMFSSGWDDGTRNSPVANPGYSCNNYYQNFYFNYGGYHFICSDFNARYKFQVIYNGVVYYTGAGVKGELTYTWDNWFKTKYNSIAKNNKERILIFSHIPAVSWSHPITGVQYGFEPGDLSQITGFLYDNDNYNDSALWVCGHFHTDQASTYYVNLYNSTYQFVCPIVHARTSQSGNIQLINLYDNN